MQFSISETIREMNRILCRFRGATLVRESQEIKSTFDGTSARLRISCCKTEHAGSYKVVVSNEFGKAESRADLKVVGKLLQQFLLLNYFYII
jgi:hypothetical protein